MVGFLPQICGSDNFDGRSPRFERLSWRRSTASNTRFPPDASNWRVPSKNSRILYHRPALYILRSRHAAKPVMKPAVFLDRDGTLNIEKHYLCDPDQLEVYPGVGRALRQLRDAGFLLFIVTNQAGIGRGYYTEREMHAVHGRLLQFLEPENIAFDRIYFAPEAPSTPSRGRKPSPQFLFDARDEFGVDLPRSYMIGDKLIDLEAGWNAGCAASLLVRTGYGAEVEKNRPANIERAIVVDDVPAAVEWILARTAQVNAGGFV